MSIYTPHESIIADRLHDEDAFVLSQQACTKIEFRGYQISIAMDNSLGTMSDLGRTEIRVFEDGEDVTEQFNGPGYGAEDLFELMQKIVRAVAKWED